MARLVLFARERPYFQVLAEFLIDVNRIGKGPIKQFCPQKKGEQKPRGNLYSNTQTRKSKKRLQRKNF
jgi:hypothetical protein